MPVFPNEGRAMFGIMAVLGTYSEFRTLEMANEWSIKNAPSVRNAGSMRLM